MEQLIKEKGTNTRIILTVANQVKVVLEKESRGIQILSEDMELSEEVAKVFVNIFELV